MRLLGFRVENFRSVQDSGWLSLDDVTALIGVNESGKTNLLLPLWKLNPAREGEIDPLADYPKAMFGEIREDPGSYRFITADFSAGSAHADLAEATGLSLSDETVVRIVKYYDGTVGIDLPGHEPPRRAPSADVQRVLNDVRTALSSAKVLKTEVGVAETLTEAIDGEISMLSEVDDLVSVRLKQMIQRLEASLPEEPAKTSVLVPAMQQGIDTLGSIQAEITRPPPGTMDGVEDVIGRALPKFVYYSNYGNLDSEIYLPHVIDDMAREDLGTKAAAKVRTLRVLFSFVRLNAEEIKELGRDPKDVVPQNRQPTAEEISEAQKRKKERSTLLQNAGINLTQKFRDWWKQGNYQFRFEADGDFFRIWVKDDERPSEVELENRSTGLQWFLSFYLVFLVESRNQHKGAVLLLDEPGMSLHPLAQRDLSEFFDELSRTNQIVYTSHSPFLIDPDRLDRARKVYVESGFTKVTADLRKSATEKGQQGAAYAVHSALNLTVAESLLLGCRPVLVEGASDQHYLTAIKTLLISGGKITPDRELVFPPTGGTKTARITAGILTGRDDDLPMILLDADKPGRSMAKTLQGELYASAQDRVLSVGSFVDIENAEIEDLFPATFLADELDRMERGAEERIADQIEDGRPFVGQVEVWAAHNEVALAPSWKVDLSIRVKSQAIKRGLGQFDDAYVKRWVQLFEAFG